MKRYAIVSAAVLSLLSACGPTTDVRLEAIDPLVGAWRSQLAFRDGALAGLVSECLGKRGYSARTPKRMASD